MAPDPMPDQSSAATEHAILQEITRPLEALPDDPLSVVDADFPSALRGYDRLAVDEYVRQTRRLVAELQATRSPEAAVRRALERVGDQISGILQRAHETAEQITAQSRSEAEDRMEHARREADEIASAAERRVRDLDSDTDRIWLERQRIVADAEDLAAQLLALARTAGERFPADPEPEAAAERGEPDDDVAGYHDAAPEAEGAYAAETAQVPVDDDYDDGQLESYDGEDVATAMPAPNSGGDDADDGDDTDAHDQHAASEVEQTRAFKPLTPRAHDDDSTTVIPPASQAANRRQAE